MKKHTSGRLLSAFSAAAMTASMIGAMPPVSVSAALSGQDAKSIVSKMTIGWNLGNTLDSYDNSLGTTAAPKKYAKSWGNPEPSAEQFQAIKDGGFNTVRIPTTWYQHITWDEGSKMYLVNEEWMGYVKSTVDYAIDRDMFVILNVHHENWVNVSTFTDDTYKEAEKKLTDIWTQVAAEFKDYDQHLIFEGLNEPRQTGNPNVSEWGNGTEDGGYTTNYVNNLNAAFVKAVRGNGSAANKERLLMLPGYVASSDPTAIRNIKIPDGAGNVALSVHAYAPYYFTMAHDEKANHSFPGKSGWGEDYESALSSMFDEFGKIQQEKNAPIIIGEFSSSDFGNTEDRCRWATSYLSKAKAQGIPCVLWDNNVVDRDDGEAHGYLYRDTCTWYTQSKPVVEAMMKVYGITPTLPDYKEAPKPVFSWADRKIGDNWIELYRDEKGKTLKEWKNFSISGYETYLDGNYDFVLFYQSDAEPEFVLQGEDIWDRIASSDDSETPFTKTFTYEDVKSAITGAGHDFSVMTNLYISATTKDLTAYGVYAVPREGTQQPTETIPATTEKNNTYKLKIGVVDKQTGKPLSGVKIKYPGGEWISDGTVFETTYQYDEMQLMRVFVADIPEGYQNPEIAEYGTGHYQLAGYNLSITFRIPPIAQETTQPSTGEDPFLAGDRLYGDVNADGSVDIMDVIAVNKYLVGAKELTGNAAKAADVNLDATIGPEDSLLILKYAVDMIDTLPVQ